MSVIQALSIAQTTAEIVAVGAAAVAVLYVAVLAGAFALFSWQEKRPYRLPDRQRAEGF